MSVQGEGAPIPVSRAIEELLNQGQVEDARRVLDLLQSKRPGDPQVLFLTGLVAVGTGDYAAAIRIFRRLLIDHPEAARVRLELARAFFLSKDYGNARRQFQFARAANPPPEVIANIDRYLLLIRQEKTVSYTASLSLAPDSNINAASSTREVTLFGLPFELNEDAQQHSGVGVALDGNVEWAPRLSANDRLRLGAGLSRHEYSGSKYDDMTLAAYAGPRHVSNRWDLGLLATGYMRWYGGEVYSHSGGARAEATYYPRPELGISGSFSAQYVSIAPQPQMSGMLWSGGLGAFHALGATSAITLKTGINRQQARYSAFANWSGFVAAGYYRDLPGGFSAYFEPSLSYSHYDAALPAIGTVRSDRSISATLALLNRHIVLARFTPRIAYTYTNQNSTVPIYTFGRNRVEIGLTTSF